MNTATSDHLPTGYRKPPRFCPSAQAAQLWENRKVSNPWYWPTLALLCAISLLPGYVQFMEYWVEFLAQGATRAVTWGRGSLVSSMLFTPLAVDVFTTQSVVGEHEGRSWQRMSASGLAGTMVAGKLLYTMQTTLASVLVSLIRFVVTGLLLGFDPVGLDSYLARVAPIALSTRVAEVFVMWVGTIANSFAVVISILLLTTTGGFVLSLAAPLVVSLYSLSLIASVSASRRPGSITSVGSMLATGSIAVVWVVFWVSTLLCRITRNP